MLTAHGCAAQQVSKAIYTGCSPLQGCVQPALCRCVSQWGREGLRLILFSSLIAACFLQLKVWLLWGMPAGCEEHTSCAAPRSLLVESVMSTSMGNDTDEAVAYRSTNVLLGFEPAS